MPIVGFENLLLPLLKIAGDGQEHSLSDTIDALARQFGLTEEERNELLPSGRQARFDNRVGWAKTHLSKAGLLESVGRGKFRITQRGREVLGRGLTELDLKFLDEFPEHVEFRRRPRQDHRPDERSVEDQAIEQTPEERLESSYQNLRQALVQEILERVKGCPPRFFERLVVDLLVSMGYGGSRQDAGRAVGQRGDDGIDGIINEDRLGLDVVYIQAKRWEQTVGRPVVQAFAGSLEGHRARKGVLLTTSRFSQDARDYVSRIEKKIVLVDGEQLAQLLIDYGIGVTEVATYTIKRIDNDYFEE